MSVSKDFPWFPLHVDSILSSRSIALMSGFEFGLYIKLLCWEWRDGPLPHDRQDMLELCLSNADAMHMDSESIAKGLDRVLKKFQKTPDGWVNEKLEQIRQEQVNKAVSLSDRGRRGAQARWGVDATANAQAMPKQCLSNGIKIKTKTKTKNEDTDAGAREELDEPLDPETVAKGFHLVGDQPAHVAAGLLARLVHENDPSATLPSTSEGWAVCLQRLHTRDSRPWDEIEEVIRYSQSDPHWRACVFGAHDLDRHYRTMRMQLRRDGGNGSDDGPAKPDRIIYESLEFEYNEDGPEAAAAWIGRQKPELHEPLKARLAAMDCGLLEGKGTP